MSRTKKHIIVAALLSIVILGGTSSILAGTKAYDTTQPKQTHELGNLTNQTRKISANTKPTSGGSAIVSIRTKNGKTTIASKSFNPYYVSSDLVSSVAAGVIRSVYVEPSTKGNRIKGVLGADIN